MVALATNRISNSSDIYFDLRRRLISAHFVPGEKLKPEDLRGQYGCAASTIREVLFRLSCDNFVDAEEHKGFRVPRISTNMCSEAAQLRIILECEGARLSILKGSLNWEAQLAAAYHKLAHVEAKLFQMEKNTELFDLWCSCEWEFHDRLVSACGSDMMRRRHKDAYDLHRLHMLAILDSENDTGFRDGNIFEHKAILKAAIERDAEACQRHIRTHLKLVG